MESLSKFFGNKRRKCHIPVEKACFDFWEPDDREDEEIKLGSSQNETNVKRIFLYLLPIFSMLAIIVFIS